MVDSLILYGPALLRGLSLTLIYFLLGAVGSLVFGLPVALGAGSPSKVIRYPVIAFIEFFRNTPILVQLFWIHFALPAITGISTTAEQTAGIAVVFVMTAYMAEVYRGGFGAVGNGQIEAAFALGLKPVHRWRLVIIPQAVAIAMPAISNTLIALLKATAILSILSVPELMRVTSRISDYTANPVFFYSVSAVLYIGVGLIISAGLAALDGHLNRWRVR